MTPVTSVTILSMVPPSPSIGDSVTFGVSSSGGSETPEYQLWVLNPSTQVWSNSGPYGPSPLIWNTAGLPSGVYNVQVWARNVGSTVNYEAYIYTPYSLAMSYLLDVMLPASLQELGTAQESVAGITRTLADYCSKRDVYQAIQWLCKDNLMSKIASKASGHSPGWMQQRWQPNSYYTFEVTVRGGQYPNGLVYSTEIWAGHSGMTEPDWPLTPGETVVDGELTWTCAEAYISTVFGPTFGVTDLSSWSVSDMPGNFPVYSLTTNWDFDVDMRRDMADWKVMYDILSTPNLGILSMISNLSNGISMMQTQKDLTAAKNRVIKRYA